MLLWQCLPAAQARDAAVLNGCAASCGYHRHWLTFVASSYTHDQIVEVINERKLAKTLSGFINQIFDKACCCASREPACSLGLPSACFTDEPCKCVV